MSSYVTKVCKCVEMALKALVILNTDFTVCLNILSIFLLDKIDFHKYECKKIHRKCLHLDRQCSGWNFAVNAFDFVFFLSKFRTAGENFHNQQLWRFWESSRPLCSFVWGHLCCKKKHFWVYNFNFQAWKYVSIKRTQDFARLWFCPESFFSRSDMRR